MKSECRHFHFVGESIAVKNLQYHLRCRIKLVCIRHAVAELIISLLPVGGKICILSRVCAGIFLQARRLIRISVYGTKRQSLYAFYHRKDIGRDSAVGKLRAEFVAHIVAVMSDIRTRMSQRIEHIRRLAFCHFVLRDIFADILYPCGVNRAAAKLCYAHIVYLPVCAVPLIICGIFCAVGSVISLEIVVIAHRAGDKCASLGKGHRPVGIKSAVAVALYKAAFLCICDSGIIMLTGGNIRKDRGVGIVIPELAVGKSGFYLCHPHGKGISVYFPACTRADFVDAVALNPAYRFGIPFARCRIGKKPHARECCQHQYEDDYFCEFFHQAPPSHSAAVIFVYAYIPI